jgi:hypothetical protein
VVTIPFVIHQHRGIVIFRVEAMARFAGRVHGVVVQITIDQSCPEPV